MKIQYTPTISRRDFKRLGKKRQRVLIAQDVLARIKAKLIVAESGVMFGGNDTEATQEHVNTTQCSVCAKGAIACAWLGNLNHYKSLASFDIDGNQAKAGTKEVVESFGRHLWDAIQCAFEGAAFSWHSLQVRDNESDIVASFSRFTNETNRIAAIMQNIVDNDGRLMLKDGALIG
jgi:hypothetical protein